MNNTHTPLREIGLRPCVVTNLKLQLVWEVVLMITLPNILEPRSKTISSRQIAERTGKRHDHVKRDIEKMLNELGFSHPAFGGTYLDAQNKERKQYLLDEKHALFLAAGYSAKLRMQIIELCDELHNKKELTYEEQVMNVITMSQAKIARNLLFAGCAFRKHYFRDLWQTCSRCKM